MSNESPDDKNVNITVLVCQGTGCVSSKSPDIYDALGDAIDEVGLMGKVEIKFTGCHGFCQQGPIIIIEPEGIFYTKVSVEDVKDIIESHILKGQWVERLFYHDPRTDEPIPHYRDIPFYRQQQRITLRNCGHIDPERIEDYLEVGGYQALGKVLSGMTPEEVIGEIKNAGLRGRGGAGFPTGVKWSFCRAAQGHTKYLICNADEGDPGAFMDRSILEADPHSVVEGSIIAAYAIGASEGYIYVRTEYPLAVRRFQVAVHQAEEYGFLGENILDSGFDFSMKIVQGSGAFVCGEETALIASIESRPPEPRIRPPFPATSGLWNKPTNINNVKTLATVPVIIQRGADWYASIGTEKSKGTMVFALTGKIANSGLVEVPMGTTLREIIYEIGGGMTDGKRFKAVQTGGPSGGCIPADLIDIPLDYERLDEVGSIMGSGGMIVMDEDTCMIDVSRFFIDFTKDESCGRCNSCREGLGAIMELLTRISEGGGREEDIPFLSELAHAVKDFSLCALGGTAPNPVLTTLRYFKDEYEAHIKDKRCPAKVCKALIHYEINPDVCNGCGLCRIQCPREAIEGEKKKPHAIDPAKCIKCGECVDSCRFDAVEVV